MSSSAHDLAAQIDGTKDRSENLSAEIASDIQLTEDAKNMFLEVGKESATSMLEQVQSELEEADSIRDAMTGGLEKARWLVMAVITGISAGTTSNSRVTSSTHTEKHGGADVQITVNSSPDVSSSSDDSNEKTSQVGKPLTAPSDLDQPKDVKTGRTLRLGRNMIRNVEGMKDYGEDTANSATFLARDAYNPLEGSTPQSPVDTRPPPVASSTTGDVQASDIVGTSVVLAAAAIEGASRFTRYLKRKKAN